MQKFQVGRRITGNDRRRYLGLSRMGGIPSSEDDATWELRMGKVGHHFYNLTVYYYRRYIGCRWLPYGAYPSADFGWWGYLYE